MAKRKENTQNSPVVTPKSAEVAERGITTGADFANLMSALMADVICGRLKPEIATATCKAGGQLLRVVELQMKHGVTQDGGGKVLRLAMNSPLISPQTTQ